MSRFILVTGSDSSHFKSLCQFLTSACEHSDDITQIVVYDLGLESIELEELLTKFPNIILKTFQFSKYPQYFDIKTNAGEYAWKPTILTKILTEYKCAACWMDAGNVLTMQTKRLRKLTKLLGLYSPLSSGTLAEWTHKSTLEYLKVSKKIQEQINLTGGCVSIDYANPKALSLAKKWSEYAMVKECIAPNGSNRENHRQDQSLLSILSYQVGIPNKLALKLLPPTGIQFHQDIG